MVDAYSPVAAGRALGTPGVPALATGVYAQVPGPQFETPAEVAMLRTMGADVVGMSMALETIAARHAGAEVLGLAVVTNRRPGPLRAWRRGRGGGGAAARRPWPRSSATS